MRFRLNINRLAGVLAASRISQNHWAIRLGLSRGHWSDIVNGRHPYPSTKTRERMIEVFGINDLFIHEIGAGEDVAFRMAVSGRYELTTELGRGGMGTVFLANDLALGRLVALKAVSAEAAAGIGTDQLLQEISVVSRLQHPNILSLFDAGAGAGSPYYVMPYVRGGSLGARLRARGRLSLGEVNGMLRDVASGIGHAHAHRVLHCDIKPENILVDGAHAYVMDFGIARKLHTEAAEWEGIRKELDFSAGTPAYVSPEQAADGGMIDERSDVYSLGCVVYEMLSGRPAFAGNNTQEIVSLRFREPPPPLQQFAPDVPYAVVRVIERAMSLDPDRRPRTAIAFADEFHDAARSASPVRTAVTIAATRARHWVLARAGGTGPVPASGGWLRRAIDALRQDIVYGIRQRRRAPGLTAVALLTLALAIGLTTAVFALVDGVMLRPLPFVHPDQLVALESVDSVGNSIATVSSSNWYDWRNDNTTLDGVAIYAQMRASVVANGDASRVEWANVSPEFFRVMAPPLVFGRRFDSTAVATGAEGVLVSERFWRARLGAVRDSTLAVQVNGFPYVVIGVVAAGQSFPSDVDVWTAYAHRQIGGAARNNINWHAVARLRPGISAERAEADLTQIARRIHAAEPQALYSHGVHVMALQEQLVGGSESLLTLLTGSVVLVLLIGCANLASANLAQGSHRQREMAVRSALGAGRRRLIRQVLVENVAIALVGGGAGIALAWVLIRLAAQAGAAELPKIAEISINGSVLAAALGVSAAAGILTGLLPALQAARAQPNEVIGTSARRVVLGGRGLPGRVLVGAEIALALMLVTGAGLLVQSFRAVLARPLGFETSHVAMARVTLGGPRYQQDSVAFFSYWDHLLGSLRGTPGVQSAGLAVFVPLVFGGSGFIEIEGKDFPGAGAGYRIISDEYFRTLKMSVNAGRDFASEDRAGSPRVGLVNALMAERYWPGESPIGRRVRASSMEPSLNGKPADWITVIGVVNDVRHFGYESDPRPEMYVLYRQLPTWRLGTLTALVRGSGRDADLLRATRAAITAADPTVPADVELLSDAARRNTAARSFAKTVLEAFGALSLLLAGIGVYGVLSFSVAQRTREMAVRAALGADRSRLLVLVLGNGAGVLLAGLGVGLLGAIAGARLIQSMLFDVSPRDPFVLTVATAAIALVGALAAIIPARRAMRVDPMVAMRNE